jgi:transcriptional regulator with XRE-family HTH domain
MLDEEDWTQSRLAKESGVPQPTISKFLAGKKIYSDKVDMILPFIYGDKRPAQPDEDEAA